MQLILITTKIISFQLTYVEFRYFGLKLSKSALFTAEIHLLTLSVNIMKIMNSKLLPRPDFIFKRNIPKLLLCFVLMCFTVPLIYLITSYQNNFSESGKVDRKSMYLSTSILFRSFFKAIYIRCKKYFLCMLVISI